MDWWWSWLLTLTGVTTFFLAGKKVWWAWYIGLFINQPIWLIYGVLSEQWGFIASTLFYTWVYTKNAISWTKEERRKKRVCPRCQGEGWYTKPWGGWTRFECEKCRGKGEV